MYKKFLVLLMVLSLVLSSSPVMAANVTDNKANTDNSTVKKYLYTSTIIVGKDGGTFKVAPFVKLQFPNNFLKGVYLPIILKTVVCAKNGEPGIEITDIYGDGIDRFKNKYKTVSIIVDACNGLLYDIITRKNISVQIKSQTIEVSHFSWYKFR